MNETIWILWMIPKKQKTNSLNVSKIINGIIKILWFFQRK